MKLIAGLDVGTTGCKVTVFTPDGKCLGREYATYKTTRTSGVHEVDAAALAAGVKGVVDAATAKFGHIDAMGVTSFGEAFVLTDGEGNPLRPILLCTDSRGAEEARAFAASFGDERAARISGVMPSESYSFPKMMWIKAHEPEVFARAKFAMLVEDYVIYLLTGERVIDHSLATRTGAFDIHRLEWSAEILDAAGIPLSLFSKPVPAGTVAGVTPSGIKVVAAGHDQVACAVGAGAFEPGTAAEGAGTVECVTPVFRDIPSGIGFQKDNYCVVPYFGNYVTYAFSHTGGELLRWCADDICGRPHAELQSGTYDGPTGLLVLPYLAGAATPYMDSGAKGAIVGLTLGTKAREVYLACMEAVAYEMRLNMERLATSGVKFDRLVATGGGARSKLWMQMKSDVLGIPFDALEVEDAGTVGCAMMAGVACGAFRDLSEAKSVMVRKAGSFEPDAARHARYAEVFERYVKLYAAVRPLM